MSRKTPILFTLIVFLIATSACLVLAAWFRQFSLIFGTGIKTAMGIIAQSLFALTLGSWIFGWLADKIRYPLIVSASLSFCASLIIFFQKYLFNLISNVTDSEMAPFYLMFVPCLAIAGSIPLLIRFFIRSLNHAGIFMSRILFAVSAAVIFSIVLSVVVIVPLAGIQALFTAGGTSLLVAAMITALAMRKKTTEALQKPYTRAETKISRMRFRKKRIVLETGAKLTRAMLYSSVFQSFTFASMVIIYIRILIKFNQLNSVFFYAIIFGIVFTGVAVGSLLYGIIADRPANKYLTLAILQILAGIAGLLSFGLHQFISPDLFEGIYQSKSFADFTLRHILLNSLIAFTPSVLHGMSLPLAGRLYPKRLQKIGWTFGHLSGLVLLSLLAGIFVTPMIIIPIIGIHAGYIVLCFLIVLSGIYLIARDSRLIRAFRVAFVISALLVFIILIIILRILNVSQLNKVTDGSYEGSTLAARVVSNPDNTRSVYINGVYYFGSDQESLKEQILSACITMSLQPYSNNALFIGFNTGITASLIEKKGTNYITITDIAPELIRLSSSVFSEQNEDIFTESSVHIKVIDPRIHLNRFEGKYDLIYSGSEQVLLYPSRYSAEFYQICRQKLSGQGLYCQVLPYGRMDSIELLTCIKTITQAFAHTSAWYLTKESILIIASESDAIPPPYISSGNPFSDLNLPENTDDNPEINFRAKGNQRLDFLTWAQKRIPVHKSDSCLSKLDSILITFSELNRQ